MASFARREGVGYRLAANFGFAPDSTTIVGQASIEPDRDTLAGRTALEGKSVHIPDILTDPEYTWSEAIAAQWTVFVPCSEYR